MPLVGLHGRAHADCLHSFGQEIAGALTSAAFALDYSATAVYWPFDLQERIGDRNVGLLPNLLDLSGALVTVLADSHETTAFRAHLVDLACRRGLRTIHMPGVDRDMFAMSLLNVDFAELRSQADRTARLLTISDSVVIHTRCERNGERYRLKLRLGNRAGHADAGVAKPGEVINIPTGEAYIAPLEDTADGSIAINGSFPERRIPPSSQVVLSFESGRLNLALSLFSNDGPSQYCRAVLHEAETVSHEGLRLGELGIGLNPGIASVDGRTILDEKVFGTAHIAIGANRAFGGALAAPYHHDLVFSPAGLELDGETLPMHWKILPRE